MQRLAKNSCIPRSGGVVRLALLVLTVLAAGKVYAQQPLAGEFTFTTTSYPVSERESVATLTGSVGPSIRGAHVTVTRTNGASGRVLVDYTTTSGSAGAGV